MNSLPTEFSPLETPTDTNLKTALIRIAVDSMLNGEGGRFQLLLGAGGTFGESRMPAGGAEPAPANAES